MTNFTWFLLGLLGAVMSLTGYAYYLKKHEKNKL